MIAMIFFAVIAVIALVWFVVTSVMIYNELNKRNIKVHFVFLKFMIPWYANQYKEITKKETGKVGSLFYHWIISINTALVFAILALVFNYW